MNPKYLTIDEVPTEILENEKKLIKEDVEKNNTGKNEEVINKIVNGKLNKFYQESVLPEQTWIIDNKLTVKKALQNNGTVIHGFVNFRIGNK
jgi:elongation factor Ts